jgi:hypothetical protein
LVGAVVPGRCPCSACSVCPPGRARAWLATIASDNPVTSLLVGMRSLVLTDWDGGALVEGVAAIPVAGIGISLALLAVRGRLHPS